MGGTAEARRPPCMCEPAEQGRKTVVYATLETRNEAVKQCSVRVERSAVMLLPGISVSAMEVLHIATTPLKRQHL